MKLTQLKRIIVADFGIKSKESIAIKEAVYKIHELEKKVAAYEECFNKIEGELDKLIYKTENELYNKENGEVKEHLA